MGNIISAIFHGCCGQDEDVDVELHHEHFHGFVFPGLTRDVDPPVPPDVDCFCPDSGTKFVANMETERKEAKKKRKTKRKSKKKKSRTSSGARTDAAVSIPVTPEYINEIPRYELPRSNIRVTNFSGGFHAGGRSRCRQALRGYARTIEKNYGSGQ